ncbi:MAG: lipopolysaccharide heptosyltransferase II [Acidobacteria bacterium]|nr:lipopolysaccharide heptosyltransferase II [Acidobacteriota bacterium]
MRPPDCEVAVKTLRTESLQRGNILVRVPNWIGDAVLCLPALRALREALPEAEITLVARPWVQEIFARAEPRCRVIGYDLQGPHKGLWGRWRLASELGRKKFDAAILFQNAFDAALLAALAGIPIRAGYARHGRRLLLTHPVAVPQKGETPPHESHYYLELLRRLGVIEGYPQVREISLVKHGTAEEARHQLEKRIALLGGSIRNGQPLVGLSPGATYGTAKRWPAEQFAELAARLRHELGAACIFFGSPQESVLVDSLLPRAGKETISLAGKTSLADFLELVPGCDLYVTNDTGTMHVAAALGVPTLAIFGPTDEQATCPLGPHVQWLVGSAECRPCLLRQCPIDHRCMTSISVDRVLQAACALLTQRFPAPLAWQESDRG